VHGVILVVDMEWPIITNGELWFCCVRMCKAIELPFGVVSGVRPRKSTLDGGPDCPWTRSSFGGLRYPYASIGITNMFIA